MRPFRWSAAVIAVAAVALTSSAFAQVRYVRPDGSDSNNGQSPAATGAWQTVAKAIAELTNPLDTFDEIHVAKGSSTDVYSPGTGVNDTFLVLKPVTIIGGYTFTFDGTTWTESRSAGDMSTLSGNISSTAHNRHIMTIARMPFTVNLEGLRFTGGDARDQTFVDGQGGAILASSDLYGEDEFTDYAGDLAISDCSFEGNAAHAGGAIESRGWSIKIADCKFIDNVASGVLSLGVHGPAWGGAIDLSIPRESSWTSRLHLKRTLFQNNTLEPGATAGGGGGAISVRYQSQSQLVCANCKFIGNSCVVNYAGDYREGGAVFATHGGETESGAYIVPQFINCVFKGNTASTNGGALSCRYGALVKDCTLSENDAATGAGGGFYGALKGNSITEFTNSIFWGNTAAVADATFTQYQYAIALATNVPTISYTCVQAPTGVAPGTGNINLDPKFADADLRLKWASPAIGTGEETLRPADDLDANDDTDLTERHPVDLDGGPSPADEHNRLKGAQVDMGAYEHEALSTCPPDFNEDGLVNGADLGFLLAEWGQTDSAADLNFDGIVNGADLGILLAAWGQSGCYQGFMMSSGSSSGSALEALMEYMGVETVEDLTAALTEMSFEEMYQLLQSFIGN